MYILNKVIWRGGGREIKMIERETERGRWETKKKEVVEKKKEKEKEWVRERVTCAKILKKFNMMDVTGVKSSLGPDGK